MIGVMFTPNLYSFPDLEQKALEEWFKEKNDIFLQRMFELGKNVIEKTFGSAVTVTITKMSNNRYKLDAEGEAICFLEFGTGVYANPGDDVFASTMPFSIEPGSWSESDLGAGTWGEWVNSGKDPEKYPYNRRPKYGMWQAYKEMERNIDRIAREVYR